MKNNPRVYTLSAIAVGYLMIGDFSANVQNAIGNWFMTIGQILECNATFQQWIEGNIQGNNININSRQYKKGGSPYTNQQGLSQFVSPSEQEIKEIKKMINYLLSKINELEKKCK